MSEQWMGLITGVLFGVLLQQGRVLRFEKQVGAMLFRDMTIFKFMLSAIIVGMIGIQLLVSLEVVELKLKATELGGNIIGGLLFGVGWAFMGYCPGTSVGAVGEGRWHAIWALIGMLIGAVVFAELYPALKDNVLAWGSLGKLTLPGVLGLNAWVVVPVLGAIYVGLMFLFEKLKI